MEVFECDNRFNDVITRANNDNVINDLLEVIKMTNTNYQGRLYWVIL